MDKNAILGMPFGTAQNRLRKLVLFRSISPALCFRCNRSIEKADDLSIEHKTPWKSKEQFWDMGNIAFSHLKCNVSAAFRPGRDVGRENRAKTECPAGHAYDASNTYVDSRGFRNCRKCHALRVAGIGNQASLLN